MCLSSYGITIPNLINPTSLLGSVTHIVQIAVSYHSHGLSFISRASENCMLLLFHTSAYWGQKSITKSTPITIISLAQFLPEASFGLRVLSLPASVRPSVSPSVTKFVRTITHHPCMLGSPNLDRRCKRPCLWSLLFLGWLTLTFKVKFNFKIKSYPFLSLSAR